MRGLRLIELAAIAVASGILAVMAAKLIGSRGLLLADGQPVFGDFIAFWSAGRAALEGHAALVHDHAFLFAYQQQAVAGAAYVAPWNSPPTFLLVAAGLALLPYPAAAAAFLAASGVLYVYAARRLLPDARALLFAVTLPAALYHLGSAQTGLLIAGASGLALLWLDRRPLAAGALVGVLAVKPHLAILWPVLLALSGRWRAFAAAAAATSAFAIIAGLAFGFEAYGRFFENLARSQALISEQRITTPAYASLYANMLALGAPDAVAAVLQGASAAGAVVVFILIVIPGLAKREPRTQGQPLRRWPLGSGFGSASSAEPPRNDEAGAITAAAPGPASQGGGEMAALCAATLLVSPYLFFYDFTLLAVGAALLGAPRDRFEVAAAMLAWGAGLSVAIGHYVMLPLCPAAAWAVLIAAMRRAGSAAPRPAPAPHT
jgi:hypothetical protein